MTFSCQERSICGHGDLQNGGFQDIQTLAGMTKMGTTLGDKLFIIGNGFDLHHGVPSSYTAFGEYLAQVDSDTFTTIEEYLFVDEDFWYLFEERLATFDSELVIDHAEHFLMPYGAEDWSDSGHHDYEYEINEVADALSRNVRNRFAEWIRSLPIPAPGTVPLVRSVDPEAQFLNFNYTPTLQQLYGVPDANVLHIHGSAKDPMSHIVLGHGWKAEERPHLSNRVDEETDTRVAGGYDLIDRYFADTFKPTDEILAGNSSFFAGLGGITDVHVLGHSLAAVDAAYIEKVVRGIHPEANWTISYHRDPSREMERFERYRVNHERRRFERLSTL
ncbi:bacteriophage abortive infection AbiH family protein [Devosia sp. A449]